MKRILLIALALACCLGLLSSCGSTLEEEAGTTEGVETTLGGEETKNEEKDGKEEYRVKELELLFGKEDTVGSKKSAKGNYVEGASVVYDQWVSTDFVDVSAYYALKYELAAHYNLMSVAFFDGEQKYISGVGTNSFANTATVTGYVLVPEKAKYAKFTDFEGVAGGMKPLDSRFVKGYENKTSYETDLAREKYADLKVACIGDSLTEGDYGSQTAGVANRQFLNYPYYLAKALGCQTVNYGLCGRTAQNYYTDHYPHADISDCDVILVMLGTNGGLGGDLGTHYDKLIKRIAEDKKEDAIILLITPPSATTNTSKVNYGYAGNVASACAYITEYAQQNNLPMIDAFTYSPIQPDMENVYQANDGLHMVREGYQAFGEFIADELKMILKELK